MLPLFRNISIGVRYFYRMPEKSVIVILAEGAEEMETVVPIDILRRAEIKVTVAGLAGADSVKCARGTRIVPDDSLSNVENQSFDCVILPGGAAGSEALAKAESVGRLLKSQNEAKKLIAAICAAPIALKSHGIPASQVTSHFSVRDKLEKEGGYKYSEERVVVADNIITSQGPGTAVEFSLKIVELLQGKEKADGLIKPMILKL